MSASCRNIETKTVTVNCSECGIEFEEEVDGFDNKYIKVHIPKREIGEMIGKGGNYLKTIRIY